MKILVVDDNRTNLAVIGKFVERLGATLFTADSGETALQVFASERPDIVLLDVILPGIDGFETARRLRGMENHGEWTPIIFLSSMTADEDIETGIAAGGDDYLSKPVSEIIFGAKVRAMQRIVQARNALLQTTRQLDAANRELKRLSASDGLTGIANRRYFDDCLEREWARAQRNGSTIALLMCDVDHFKHFNDCYGHQAGDDCLRRIASALETATDRPGDICARYGGEEFAVIMPETPAGGALIVAEKLRQCVRQLAIEHAGVAEQRVTLSIGLAALSPLPGDLPANLVRLADQALYQAKEQGRNRVCRAAAD